MPVLQWEFSHTFFSKEVSMRIMGFIVCFLYAQGFTGLSPVCPDTILQGRQNQIRIFKIKP